MNGIYAEPGTIIGIEINSLRFLAIESVNWFDLSVNVRYARVEESLRESFMHEPRSIVEHKGIRKIQTPFGLARVYKPAPKKRLRLVKND